LCEVRAGKNAASPHESSNHDPGQPHARKRGDFILAEHGACFDQGGGIGVHQHEIGIFARTQGTFSSRYAIAFGGGAGDGLQKALEAQTFGEESFGKHIGEENARSRYAPVGAQGVAGEFLVLRRPGVV